MIWICKDDKVCNCLPLITDLNVSLSFRKLKLNTTWVSRKRAMHFSEHHEKTKTKTKNIIVSNGKKNRGMHFSEYLWKKKSFIVRICYTKHIENKSYTALEKNTATGYLKCIYTWWTRWTLDCWNRRHINETFHNDSRYPPGRPTQVSESAKNAKNGTWFSWKFQIRCCLKWCFLTVGYVTTQDVKM